MKGLMMTLLVFIGVTAFAQKPDNDMARGNEEYKNKAYRNAEADYRISISKEPAKASADYNLGNAIYEQKQYSEALIAYARAIDKAVTKPEKHKAWHNMGNVFMKAKDYQKAIEAYKNALRNNPQDDETRYNYALAKEMLEKNPPKPPKQDDRKDPPKDDKEDNKSNVQKNRGDSGEKADGGGSKDTPQPKGGGEGAQQTKGGSDEKGDPKPAKDDPSKQRMESLLDAMNNEEKKVQDRVKGVRVKAQPKKQEKDW